MVHKINNALIIQKLEKRYKLSNVNQEPFVFLNQIQPIALVDDLVRTLTSSSTTISAASTGSKDCLVCPPNKRYHLIATSSDVSTGTTARFSHMDIRSGISTVAVTMYALATPAVNINYTFPTQIILSPGDSLRINVSTANAGDFVNLRALYYEEDY